MTGDQIVEIVKAAVPAILALLSFLGILFTGYMSYKTSRKVETVQKETSEQTASINATAVIAAQSIKKSDEIIKNTAEIHSLTNSNLSKVTAALELVQAEFRSLKDSSASEIRSLETTVARLIGDKKVAEDIAAKLADKVPTTVPGRSSSTQTLSDVTMTKSDVVIEGTLETKK